MHGNNFKAVHVAFGVICADLGMSAPFALLDSRRNAALR